MQPSRRTQQTATGRRRARNRFGKCSWRTSEMGAPAESQMMDSSGVAALKPRLRNCRFYEAGNRLRRGARRAIGLHRSASVWRHCAGRRLEHFAGISRQAWSTANRAVPRTSEAYNAQVLGNQRSPGHANANDHVYEERVHAWWRIAHIAAGSGAVEPGCAAFAIIPGTPAGGQLEFVRRAAVSRVTTTRGRIRRIA